MSLLFTLVSTSGLVDIAIKSIAVMLLAWAAAALLRRASAAWRHLVWCLSVVSLLLLPALALALPTWRVTWLPRWAAEQTHVAATGQPALAKADTIEPLDDQSPPTILLPPSAPAAATEAPGSPSTTANVTTSPPRGPVPWLAIGWAAGVLLSLVPLVVGLWQLAVLHRRSRVIGDQRWLSLLGELRRQLELRRNVQLRQSVAALVPLTWGALKPVLLVPAEASAWPDERRRLVVLHELAHVRRWDWLTQLVAHVACAMYWFNPLVWLAARQMRIERERACDDLVLASGARASDYAQELLALSAGLSNSQLSTLVAVPMARRGVLEDRLRGILDSRRSRAALTTTAVCLGAALAAAASGPLAMLRAAPPESAASETEEPHQEPPVKEKPAAEKPAEKPAAKTVTIRGKVVDDATGKPIERIIVQWGKFEPADPKKVTWGSVETRSSSRDGSFSTTIRWDEGWTARVFADGYIPQPVITTAPPAGKDEVKVTIRLNLGPKVRGVVLDHAGKPVKDAAVFAIGPTALNLAAGQAIDNESQSVRTDADGRFELPIGEAKSVAVSYAAFDAWPAAIPAKGDVIIRLPEPSRVEIELNVDGADKESRIFYQLLTQDRPEFAGLRLQREVTMANPGKLSLAALPPGKYQLARNVTNHLGEIDTGAMLDRQFFELKAGEKKSIDFVRAKGARVRGKVTWPADTKLMGIVVSVRSEKAEKSPFNEHEWTTVYASQTAAADGTFLTERISPGTYLIVASAYTPLTPQQRQSPRLGHRAPSFQAQVTIEVPADGEVKAGDLVLKPIRAEERKEEPQVKEKPAAEKPAEKPAEAAATKTAMVRGKVVDDATGEPRSIVVPAEGEVTVEDLTLKAIQPKEASQPPAQPKQQPAKSDHERMEGNWFITNDDSMRRGEMWVITKDRILMYAKHSGINVNLYLHRLDAGKDPKQIDITVTLVNGKSVGVIKGIYAFDGDELRLCLGAMDKDRPAAFPKQPGPGEVLILKRQTPGVEQPKAKEDQAAAKKDQKKSEEQTTKEEMLRVLIDKVLAAHGGEDKLNKLNSFTMTVKHSNGETQQYFVQPPKNFRWETTHRDQTGKRIVIHFPEGRRWWGKEPNEEAKEFFLTGIEPPVGYWHDNVQFFGPRQVLRLKDAEHKVALLDEEAEINDGAAIGVEVTGLHFKGKMYFDKETHLLVKRTADSYYRSQGFIIYSDYKTFDGIPVAQKENDGYFMPEVIEFKAVDKLDVKLFERP